jgi:hypothetical protein
VSETSPPGDDRAQPAALSRDLSEFLLELSIGVHRYAMYPPDHPSLLPAAENIIGRLGEIFMDRRSLSIGVARNQLVIEGVATESKHPVLRDLAKRLHGHQLGALSFTKGVVVKEVEGLLTTLAQDPEREGDPLGLLPPDQLPTWPHARLFRLGYDQLELRDQGQAEEQEPERATHLWLGLARSAMATDDPEKASASTDAESIASSIKSRKQETSYDQVIVGYLLQLADELKSGKGGESETIRKRVSTLIRELDKPTLARLVGLGGSLDQRKKFVLDANQSLAVDSVMKILEAAADASHQTISHSLTRLLSKLSNHASQGTARVRDQADTALRDNVEELIKDWDLTDPNPDEYTMILDSMAKAAPVFHVEEDEEEGGDLTGAHRVFQMALEVDSWGPTVVKAVSDLTDAGEVAYLLEMADEAGDDSVVAERLREYFTNPKQLKRLLAGADVDEATLRSVVECMGSAAIPSLLDALTESEARSVRRKTFDVLAQIGDEVGEAIMTRLDEPRWFVVRNMLALVQRLPQRPKGFTAGPFMDHKDSRVRREAFPLAMEEPSLRQRALATGLADEDERLLRMALLEIQTSLPETLVPVLVNRVIKSERPGDLRAMAVRALLHSTSALTLEVLLEVASTGKSLLRKRKIADSTPEVLASLQTLAASWSHDARAREVLTAARKSKDPEIKKAVSPTGGAG